MARQDPIELLTRQEAARLLWLVPVRHSRMAENPFAFFRGAAAVMAADLARKPSSGLMVQLCGDAHLLNFGFFCSPEYQLLFDIRAPRKIGIYQQSNDIKNAAPKAAHDAQTHA